MSSYLAEMTARLALGLANVDESRRRQHLQYLVRSQQADGGFAGRQGESDLYYTSFALRSLAILGYLDGEIAQRAGNFLGGRLRGQESVVDFLSLIYSTALLDSAAGIQVMAAACPDWQTAVETELHALRRTDGGFAKTRQGNASSMYHTFLVLLCLELMGRPITDTESLVRFVKSQSADGGGFREIRVSKRAGVNPTAAAIGILRILDALDETTKESTIDFLFEMQTDEGGMRANTRIPIADLLSSFTGLLTLTHLEAHHEVDRAALTRFAESLELDDGGFHGAAWDSAHDVEYSFYGLGCIALLSEKDS